MDSITFAIIGLISASFTLCSGLQPTFDKYNDVEDLLAIPDFRAVKLSWKTTPSTDPAGFSVQICENVGWRRKQPCRVRHLSLDSSKQKYNIHDVLRETNKRRYEANIYELRMFTNYSISVEPIFGSPPLFYTNTDFGRAEAVRPKSVQVTTKGFSARPSRCLGNTTDVEVHTGPFFAGKISVENVLDERCAIYGDPESVQSVYTLTISHSICGSEKVNDSRIVSTVLVHENRELITHNSRRFLVVCNFVTDVFTLRASLKIPKVKGSSDHHIEPIGHSVEEADPNEIYDADEQLDYKHNNVRDSRILAEQAAVVDKIPLVRKGKTAAGQLIAVVFLTTAFVVVFIGSAVWIWKSSRSMNVDSRISNNNWVDPEDIKESQSPANIEFSVDASENQDTLGKETITSEIESTDGHADAPSS